MNFFIENGVIAKVNNSVKRMLGRTDFLHILKQALDRLHVSYSDECCPETQYTPLARNQATGMLAYFDYETRAWIDTTTAVGPIDTTMDETPTAPVPEPEV